VRGRFSNSVMRSNCINPVLLQRAKDLRRDSAPAEFILWNMLRDRQLNGFKFKRQVPIEPFIADFYCAAAKLVVELDGDSHSERVVYDEQRTRILADAGLMVIRFENTNIFEHLDSVLESILTLCADRTKTSDRNTAPHPNPLPGVPGRGEKTI
jgi:very-short-patch-repair endonuclease